MCYSIICAKITGKKHKKSHGSKFNDFVLFCLSISIFYFITGIFFWKHSCNGCGCGLKKVKNVVQREIVGVCVAFTLSLLSKDENRPSHL